jgi:hypothetical protein
MDIRTRSVAHIHRAKEVAMQSRTSMLLAALAAAVAAGPALA